MQLKLYYRVGGWGSGCSYPFFLFLILNSIFSPIIHLFTVCLNLFLDLYFNMLFRMQIPVKLKSAHVLPASSKSLAASNKSSWRSFRSPMLPKSLLSCLVSCQRPSSASSVMKPISLYLHPFASLITVLMNSLKELSYESLETQCDRYMGYLLTTGKETKACVACTKI